MARPKSPVAVAEHGAKGSKSYYRYHPSGGKGVPIGTDPDDAISPARATRLAKAGVAGGFTARIFGDETTVDRYLISPYKEYEQAIGFEEIDREIVRSFVAEHSDALSRPNHFLGGWRDGDQVYLDVSVAEADLERAMELGRRNNQQAIWDRRDNVEVRISEDAGAGPRRFALLVVPATDAEIDEFVAYLKGDDDHEDDHDHDHEPEAVMETAYIDLVLALDMAEAGATAQKADPVAQRQQTLGAVMLDTDPAVAALADLRALRAKRLAGINLSDDEVRHLIRVRRTLQHGKQPTEVEVEAAFARLMPGQLPGAAQPALQRGEEWVDPEKVKQDAIDEQVQKAEIKVGAEKEIEAQGLAPSESKEHGDPSRHNYRQLHPDTPGTHSQWPTMTTAPWANDVVDRRGNGLHLGDWVRVRDLTGNQGRIKEFTAGGGGYRSTRVYVDIEGQNWGDWYRPDDLLLVTDGWSDDSLWGSSREAAMAEHSDPSRADYRSKHPGRRGWSGPPPPGAGPIGHPVGSERYELEYAGQVIADEPGWHGKDPNPAPPEWDPEDISSWSGAAKPRHQWPDTPQGQINRIGAELSGARVYVTALNGRRVAGTIGQSGLHHGGLTIDTAGGGAQFFKADEIITITRYSDMAGDPGDHIYQNPKIVKGGRDSHHFIAPNEAGESVGDFTDENEARKVVDRLRERGIGARIEETEGGYTVFREAVVDGEPEDVVTSEAMSDRSTAPWSDPRFGDWARREEVAEHGTKGTPSYGRYHPDTAGTGLNAPDADERAQQGQFWDGKEWKSYPTGRAEDYGRRASEMKFKGRTAMGKSRPTDNPYMTFEGDGFEYRVLKSYQADDSKPYARWFLATKSPYTMGSWELGDGYVAEVVNGASMTYKDPVLGDYEPPTNVKRTPSFFGEGETVLVEVDASAKPESIKFAEAGIAGDPVTFAEAGAEFNDATREVWITPIRPGWGNARDGFYYTKEALQQAVTDGLFDGRKMYANHPRRSDEKDLPERDVRDWVATVKETVWDNRRQQPRARLRVYDKGAYERFKDAPEEIAFSILGGGVARPGKVGNREARIVEALKNIRSIDWVTEAGAGGAIDFAESANEEFEMSLENLTAEQLKDANPALYAALTGVREAEGESPEGEFVPRAEFDQVKQELAELRLKDDAAAANKDAQAVVEAAVAATALPRAAKAHITEQFHEATLGEGFLFGEEKGLRDAVDQEIAKMERLTAGLKGRAPVVKNLGASTEISTEPQATVRESIADRLDRKFGDVPKAEGSATISESGASVEDRLSARI